MFRFDAKKAYYLYPEADNLNDLELLLNQGSSFEKNVSPREDISVVKHGLKIPASDGAYSDFIEKIKISETAFKSIF